MTLGEKVKFISDHRGYEYQSRQCIEEMAELTQSINKMWRFGQKCGKTGIDDAYRDTRLFKNIIEEIADVQVCLLHMSYLAGISAEELSGICERKTDREVERINREENKDDRDRDF